MNKLIWTKSNSLSSDFCHYIINKFENDDRKETGTTLLGINKNVKSSTDLLISNLLDWKEEDNTLYSSLHIGIREYEEYCTQINRRLSFATNDLNDTGYQIQRTYPGEFYDWHSDFDFDNNRVRILTYIWYLNDICYDGETEFIDGTIIKPETGKLLIFPSDWTYVHRGITPKKEVKYICTGWIYANKN